MVSPAGSVDRRPGAGRARRSRCGLAGAERVARRRPAGRAAPGRGRGRRSGAGRSDDVVAAGSIRARRRRRNACSRPAPAAARGTRRDTRPVQAVARSASRYGGSRADRSGSPGSYRLVEEGVGERQRLGAHRQAVVAELPERQPDERVAVVEGAAVPDHPQRRRRPAGPASTASRSSTTVGRAVVDDLVGGGAGHPVDDVAVGVVAAGVLGGRVRSPGTARPAAGPRSPGVATARHGDRRVCPVGQAVVVGVGGEGELGHRVGRRAPTGWCAGPSRNGKKIALPAPIAGRGGTPRGRPAASR